MFKGKLPEVFKKIEKAAHGKLNWVTNAEIKLYVEKADWRPTWDDSAKEFICAIINNSAEWELPLFKLEEIGADRNTFFTQQSIEKCKNFAAATGRGLPIFISECEDKILQLNAQINFPSTSSSAESNNMVDVQSDLSADKEMIKKEEESKSLFGDLAFKLDFLSPEELEAISILSQWKIKRINQKSAPDSIENQPTQNVNNLGENSDVSKPEYASSSLDNIE